jgi:hypothetical protein
MIIITREWLEKKDACTDGKEWCLSHGELPINNLLPIFLKHKKYNWFNWLLMRLMNKKQKVMYAIYAAELVIHIFEDKYPKDKRPRKAIAAAKEYLKTPCARTKKLTYAADAAAAADAADAADAAAYAAYAADAAAYAAAYAADAAAYAADAAAYAAAYAAAAAEKKKTYERIFLYGLELINPTKGS